MTDRAWFDAAKGDIPQWAASMPKDADGTTIDWDWVRSLDLAHGVGTIPESTPQSIHDALKADYATRERLESIIAQCNSAFMTDFDRFIGSYRLPRALAYANRRLNANTGRTGSGRLWCTSRSQSPNTYGRSVANGGGGPPLPCSSRTPAAARRTMTKACWI